MLYNIALKKVHTNADCMKCHYFDKDKKKCKGIGKVCYEYDEKNNTISDPVTNQKVKVGE